MIVVTLLAAAAPAPPLQRAPQSAIEAERAFAADAQKLGQWTAFRKYAGLGAVMFVPKAVNAQQWLRGKVDPPKSVRWQLAESFQACDRRTAINVGPWQRPDGSFGYFTTVWLYEDALVSGPRWMWAFDAGDTLKLPMIASRKPKLRRAACKGIPSTLDDQQRYAIPSISVPDAPEAQEAKLHSRDRSLRYDYRVDPAGNRTFKAWLWNGSVYKKVVDQTVAAVPK